MDISKMKALSYEDLRGQYREYLLRQKLNPLSVSTAFSDTFYLWRKGSRDQFWSVVESPKFEEVAKASLINTLSENSTGDISKLVGGYLSHLRRFCLFLSSDGSAETDHVTKTTKKATPAPRKKKSDINVPNPSVDQIEQYLALWDALENYSLQEDALDKLFFELCPKNTDISDILLKASTLNDFYSTNIFSIYPVAKHILSLDIDDRLKDGDFTLVGDIQHIAINGVAKNFYSFSTKYCSHHNPLDFPIYDSYVDEVLRYFRKRDGFSDFQDLDLKDFVRFKDVLMDFRSFYGLGQFNLKQIDKYIWQLGKDYFPKSYGKKKGRYSEGVES